MTAHRAPSRAHLVWASRPSTGTRAPCPGLARTRWQVFHLHDTRPEAQALRREGTCPTLRGSIPSGVFCPCGSCVSHYTVTETVLQAGPRPRPRVVQAPSANSRGALLPSEPRPGCTARPAEWLPVPPLPSPAPPPPRPAWPKAEFPQGNTKDWPFIMLTVIHLEANSCPFPQLLGQEAG